MVAMPTIRKAVTRLRCEWKIDRMSGVSERVMHKEIL